MAYINMSTTLLSQYSNATSLAQVTVLHANEFFNTKVGKMSTHTLFSNIQSHLMWVRLQIKWSERNSMMLGIYLRRPVVKFQLHRNNLKMEKQM